jgi:RHS repeat-associated protein
MKRFWHFQALNRVGIRNSTDYSPFGVELDGRTVSLDGYRFGYQGSEKDNEFKGQGNSYTTEFRQLDPRLGRWLTIDPLFAKFPGQSSYTSFDNNPILLIDHLGTETESGPGDGYTKNKDGTRSKTNANGTKTYDAPGFSSVTLPANAKVIGTMQDVDGKIDGAIHNNGVRYQATVGDLARFEINNVEYIAQFSSGTFINYEDKNGREYVFIPSSNILETEKIQEESAYQLSDNLGQMMNVGGVIWGGAQKAGQLIQQNNGAQFLGNYLGVGTQQTATALRGTVKILGNFGGNIGTVGMVFSSINYISQGLDNSQTISTATHANFWISAGIFSATVLIGGPITGGAALLYGAGQFGSYIITGNTLEENLLEK